MKKYSLFFLLFITSLSFFYKLVAMEIELKDVPKEKVLQTTKKNLENEREKLDQEKTKEEEYRKEKEELKNIDLSKKSKDEQKEIEQKINLAETNEKQTIENQKKYKKRISVLNERISQLESELASLVEVKKSEIKIKESAIPELPKIDLTKLKQTATNLFTSVVNLIKKFVKNFKISLKRALESPVRTNYEDVQKKLAITEKKLYGTITAEERAVKREKARNLKTTDPNYNVEYSNLLKNFDNAKELLSNVAKQDVANQISAEYVNYSSPYTNEYKKQIKQAFELKNLEELKKLKEEMDKTKESTKKQALSDIASFINKVVIDTPERQNIFYKALFGIDNPYFALGIDQNASQETITNKYNTLEKTDSVKKAYKQLTEDRPAVDDNLELVQLIIKDNTEFYDAAQKMVSQHFDDITSFINKSFTDLQEQITTEPPPG